VESKPIGEIQLSDGASVKVSTFAGRDGKARADIRLFVAGERYTGPTKRGVTLPVERVPELIKLLQQTGGDGRYRLTASSGPTA